MKRLLLLVLFFAATATAMAQYDFSLNVTDSVQVVLTEEESPVYLIVGYPDSYVDSLIRDCGANEEELDNLYTALDDYGWYLNACYTAIDSLGWHYRLVDSDIDIYVEKEKRHYRMPSRSFVGVVVYKKEQPLEFVELIDFLNRVTIFDD